MCVVVGLLAKIVLAMGELTFVAHLAIAILFKMAAQLGLILRIIMKSFAIILLSKSSIKKCLTESTSRIDESLMLPIRWSRVGLILRGGWLFGKNKESFGHNGWGGSLGFADPTLGIGVAYTTNKINPTMGTDFRIINLLKEFYKLH